MSGMRMATCTGGKGEEKKNKRRQDNRKYSKKVLCRDFEPSTSLKLGPNGEVNYYKSFFPDLKAATIFQSCLVLGSTVERPSFVCNNRLVKQPRKSIWFGPVEYRYSKYVLQNLDFGSCGWLDILKRDISYIFDYNFNSCLINIYENNVDKVEWHADDESIFGVDPFIVSLSFGAIRNFEMCKRPSPGISFRDLDAQYIFSLEHGSVLSMKGDIQRCYLHRVPSEHNLCGTRVNLTFRNVVS